MVIGGGGEGHESKNTFQKTQKILFYRFNSKFCTPCSTHNKKDLSIFAPRYFIKNGLFRFIHEPPKWSFSQYEFEYRG